MVVGVMITFFPKFERLRRRGAGSGVDRDGITVLF